jgi:hypothetical protein
MLNKSTHKRIMKVECIKPVPQTVIVLHKVSMVSGMGFTLFVISRTIYPMDVKNRARGKIIFPAMFTLIIMNFINSGVENMNKKPTREVAANLGIKQWMALATPIFPDVENKMQR